MLRIRFVLTACTLLALGCGGRPEGAGANDDAGAGPPSPADETQEIIENLRLAGFPREDIMVAGGAVYVGRDAEVSLAASREMLQAGGGEEQYRTNNLVSSSLTKICVNGSTFTGAFSTALDLAIQNYDELPLSFAMARTPSSGCGFTINAVIQPGVVGGSAGFPSGGLPFGTINIGGGLSTFSVDVIEHVITHELGHTIGFRHSDFFNRSISCGTGGNEGDAGVGANLIPGTPSGAVVGGSLMNSCFRSTETGEFTGTDLTALSALYGVSQPQLFWSSAGPIAGLVCTQIHEAADPDTWLDNYLCANTDLGLQWSSAGPVGGLRCTQTFEFAEPAEHTWLDNYICVPESSPLQFVWSQSGPVAGKTCVQWHEAADPHTWDDNFLCYLARGRGAPGPRAGPALTSASPAATPARGGCRRRCAQSPAEPGRRPLR